MLEQWHQVWRTWYEDLGHQCGVLVSCVKMMFNQNCNKLCKGTAIAALNSGNHTTKKEPLKFQN